MTQKQKNIHGNAWRIALIVVILAMAIYGAGNGKTKMYHSCYRNFRETYLSETTKACPFCGYKFVNVESAHK